MKDALLFDLKWLGYALGLLAIFVISGAIYYQIKLANRKGGWTREAFVEEFQQLGVAASLAQAVYDYYQKHSVLRSFRVGPDDDLDRFYDASHEEIDEAAEELSAALGIRLPNESVLREWPNPIRTVRDVVMWLDWVSKRSNSVGHQ